MTRPQPDVTWPEGPVALHPHPATSDPWAGSLSVSLFPCNTPNGSFLRFEYLLVGAVSRLLWPGPKSEASFTEGLWQSTCMEAFVGTSDSEAYREFNFAPSGDWAIYDFARYRERSASRSNLPLLAPSIASESSTRITIRDANALVLTALAPVASIPTGLSLHWNLSAVLQTHDGQLSYWALAHPADQPDFHHPLARALTTPSSAPRP